MAITVPTNVFFLLDDYANTTGGGASGQQISPEFTAATLANATTVACIIATALQRPVRLVQKFGSGNAPPYTLVAAGLANVANTSTPSGVGY